MKLHATVKGRVQGVGFRYFVRARAEQLNLDGWVKNLADGSVELEALGFAEELNRLEEYLREGPTGSRVETVVTRRTEGKPDGSGFRIDFW